MFVSNGITPEKQKLFLYSVHFTGMFENLFKNKTNFYLWHDTTSCDVYVFICVTHIAVNQKGNDLCVCTTQRHTLVNLCVSMCALVPSSKKPQQICSCSNVTVLVTALGPVALITASVRLCLCVCSRTSLNANFYNICSSVGCTSTPKPLYTAHIQSHISPEHTQEHTAGDTGHREKTAPGASCIPDSFGERLNPSLDQLESILTA